MAIVKPVFHSIILPSPVKNLNKKFIFLHLIATEKYCSTSLVVEKRPTFAKQQRTEFFVCKYFRQRRQNA
jgi:hypothetical protein